MQVQYYHPMGPHLLYHYTAIPPNAVNAPAPHPPPPPPPPQYFAFPLMLQQQQQHHQRQQQHHQAPVPSPAAEAAAAAFFAQQQQLAGLALHFQSLSVGGNHGNHNALQVRNGSSSSSNSSSSSSSNASCSSIGPFDVERARSTSFGQPDYQWKLLVWLKTHRMHKYFDRLRKYSFEQLLNLDRDTLEAEQFTQGAIKKLLGMLERVRTDRAAFESPTRIAGTGASASGVVKIKQPQAVFPPTLSQPPPPPPLPLHPHRHLQQQNLINYRQQRFLCRQP